jgi:hypothetical protein
MMCPATDNPTIWKIDAVVCFVLAKNMGAAEIHHELYVLVYDQIVMSKRTVRQ